MTGIGSIEMSLSEAIKNSIVQMDYKIRERPGNTDVKKSVLMDPLVAILSWISERGNTDGYGTPWSNSDFTTFPRLRLSMCGDGKYYMIVYTATL